MKTLKYKHLFTDLDETLFNSKSLYNEAIRVSYEKLHSFYPKVKYTKFKELFLEVRKDLKETYVHNTISHNRAILFENLLERLGIKSNEEMILEMHEAYWFTVNVYIQLFPGVLETLQKIRDSGIKITAVSDGSLHSRLEKIISLKIADLIDFFVASEEVIYTKPEPQIFELALNKTGAQKNEIIMIGDNFDADIVGAKSFGIDCCWFNPKKKEIPKDSDIKPDFTIVRFPQLLKVLGLKD
ncbi:HAD-IA family hydrolase [Candidatus Dojkabacteria bacterium]|nr:HAD-IA family hydrolase [Candidatus Dojkabacteria bacterium]